MRSQKTVTFVVFAVRTSDSYLIEGISEQDAEENIPERRHTGNVDNIE